MFKITQFGYQTKLIFVQNTTISKVLEVLNVDLSEFEKILKVEVSQDQNLESIKLVIWQFLRFSILQN